MEYDIVTARLVIRRFGEEHLRDPKYISWLSDRENLVSLNLVDYILNPVTPDRLTGYYQSFQGSTPNKLFAVTVSDEKKFVGTVALREVGYRGLYDLGIFIGDKSVRGKGYARETIGGVVRHAFGALGARKVSSSFADDNYAVQMAFVKNGFKIEGLQRAQQCSVDGKISNRYIVGILPDELVANTNG